MSLVRLCGILSLQRPPEDGVFQTEIVKQGGEGESHVSLQHDEMEGRTDGI
jgi:hypothetical protein